MPHSTQPAPAAPDAKTLELIAYNAAFYELGLRWHWDRDTYAALQQQAPAPDCVRLYLQTRQPHLLRAYDVAFLVSAIEERKERILRDMPRDRAPCDFDWAQSDAAEVGH